MLSFTHDVYANAAEQAPRTAAQQHAEDATDILLFISLLSALAVAALRRQSYSVAAKVHRSAITSGDSALSGHAALSTSLGMTGMTGVSGTMGGVPGAPNQASQVTAVAFDRPNQTGERGNTEVSDQALGVSFLTFALAILVFVWANSRMPVKIAVTIALGTLMLSFLTWRDPLQEYVADGAYALTCIFDSDRVLE